MVEKTRPRWLRAAPWAVLVLILLLGVPALIAQLQREARDAHFALDARTEIIEVESAERARRHWYLEGAHVAGPPEYEPIEFTGRVELGPGVRLTVQRLAMGPVVIRVVREGEGPAGVLIPDSGDPALMEDSFEALIPENRAEGHLLPFTGWARIGDAVRSQVSLESPILLGGQVSMQVRHRATGNLYPAGEGRLDAGGVVTLDRPEGSGPAAAHGFIRPARDGGLEVAYDVVARGVRVERYLVEESYVLRPSVWSRLSANPEWAAFGLMASVLLGALMNVAVPRLFPGEGGPAGVGPRLIPPEPAFETSPTHASEVDELDAVPPLAGDAPRAANDEVARSRSPAP